VKGPPLRRLREIRAFEHQIDEEKLKAVREAREAGHSWGEIGMALGMTRSGAQKWFASHVDKG
jgi:hypothetical protein